MTCNIWLWQRPHPSSRWWARMGLLMLFGCTPAAAPDPPAPDPTPPAPAPPVETRPEIRVDPHAPVQTDRASYVLRPVDIPSGPSPIGHQEVVIPIRYVNRTGDTVYLAYCDSKPPRFRVEKKVDDGWVPAHRGPTCTAARSSRPFSVLPGEVYTDTLRLTHFRSERINPRFQVTPIPGVYRLVFQIFGRWNPERTREEELLPESERVSNEFRIELPEP